MQEDLEWKDDDELDDEVLPWVEAVKADADRIAASAECIRCTYQRKTAHALQSLMRMVDGGAEPRLVECHRHAVHRLADTAALAVHSCGRPDD